MTDLNRSGNRERLVCVNLVVSSLYNIDVISFIYEHRIEETEKLERKNLLIAR
jgi:hypothetical protein